MQKKEKTINIKETKLYLDVAKFLEETDNLELKKELDLILEKLTRGVSEARP